MVMTTRDRWISACFPALAVVLIYLLASARPAWTYERQLHGELANLETPDTHRIREAGLLQEISRLRNELQTTTGESLEVPTVWLGRRRIGTLRHIAALCQDEGVNLLEAKPLDKSAGLHSRTREGMQKNLEKVGWMDAQEWRLTLRGHYPTVRRVIEGLAQPEVLCLPDRIEMKPDEDSSRPHTWMLNLWM